MKADCAGTDTSGTRSAQLGRGALEHARLGYGFGIGIGLAGGEAARARARLGLG